MTRYFPRAMAASRLYARASWMLALRYSELYAVHIKCHGAQYGSCMILNIKLLVPQIPRPTAHTTAFTRSVVTLPRSDSTHDPTAASQDARWRSKSS